jgi:thiosulfate/3-mercaptopyruvate sulfurtransferase
MKTTGYPLLLGCLLLTSLLCFPAFLSAKASPLKNFDSPRLVETGEVSGILGNPSVRLIDLRTSLTDYLKGHLPNAVYLSFENLRVPRNGIPAQVPDRISLEKMMGDYLGVSNDMWVVLYSEKSNPNATFLAWTLDFLGHKRFGVLNGGWEKWSSEKLPTTQSYPPVPLKKFFGKAKRDSLAEKKGVYEHLSAKEVVIMDARPPKQYSGEEGEEMRRGHIPGAKNFFWETALEGEEVKVWKKNSWPPWESPDRERSLFTAKPAGKPATSTSPLSSSLDSQVFGSIGGPGSNGQPMEKCPSKWGWILDRHVPRKPFDTPLNTARGLEPVEGLRAVSGSIGLTAMSLPNGPVERPRS